MDGVPSVLAIGTEAAIAPLIGVPTENLEPTSSIQYPRWTKISRGRALGQSVETSRVGRMVASELKEQAIRDRVVAADGSVPVYAALEYR